MSWLSMDIFEILRQIGSLMLKGQLPELGAWSYVALAVLVAVEGPIATLLGAMGASTGIAVAMRSSWPSAPSSTRRRSTC